MALELSSEDRIHHLEMRIEQIDHPHSEAWATADDKKAEVKKIMERIAEIRKEVTE